MSKVYIHNMHFEQHIESVLGAVPSAVGIPGFVLWCALTGRLLEDLQ